MGDLLQFGKDNWVVISEHFWVFAMWAVIWISAAATFATYLKANKIESLEARLALKDDQIAHFKNNANAVAETATGSIDPMKTVGLPTLTAQVPERRTFVGEHVSVEYLTGLYAGRTKIEGNKVAQPYFGMWIEINGTVEIMTPTWGGISMTVRVFSAGKEPARAWMMFEGDQEKLEALKLDAVVKAFGKIKEIDSYHVILVDCQLL